MKTETEISDRINDLVTLLKYKEISHNKLDQISMLSGEGNKLREEVNQIKGEIKALEWVKNDKN